MQLIITGIAADFTLDAISHTLDSVIIESTALAEYIESLIPTPEAPAAPPEPEVIEYEPSDKLENYTIEQYLASGWTTEQLIEHGYLVPKAKVNPEPAAPPEPPKKETPAAPPAKEAEPKYVMAEKAAGATEQQFLDQGWDRKDLIKEGYLIHNPATKPISNSNPEWPQQTEAGSWVDSEGTLFDETKHSMTKHKEPGVTVKGVFKKRRGYVEPEAAPAPAKTEEAPAAAAAPPPPAKTTAAPAAPSASAAPAAPSAPTLGDVPLDEELDALIKEW